MVDRYFQSVVAEHFGHFFSRIPAHAVDDAAFLRMFPDEIQDGTYLVFLLVSPTDFQIQVRAVERRNEYLRVFHVQLFQDVLSCNFIGCGSQGYNRYLRKLFAEDFQLGVFRAEIVSPL